MNSFVARTHPGLRRDKNEDHYVADGVLGLWIVADGLGGHSNGEIASAIACDVIRRDVSEGVELVDAIAHAHREVLDEIARQGLDSNMGTTVVALMLRDGHYDIAWVGDSRAYLFDGHLKQLTDDHSAINELLAKGVIDSRRAAQHPQRHALSRSLGVSDRNASEPGAVSGSLKAGQQILLCTDGLTDELSDAEILAELRINAEPDEQADALVKAALAKGGHDNLTLIIVGDGVRREPATAPGTSDLEVTQNIGEPVSVSMPRSTSRRLVGALLVSAATLAGLYALWKLL